MDAERPTVVEVVSIELNKEDACDFDEECRGKEVYDLAVVTVHARNTIDHYSYGTVSIQDQC